MLSNELYGVLCRIKDDTLHRGAPVPSDTAHTLLGCRQGKARSMLVLLCEAGELWIDKAGLIYHDSALADVAHKKAISAIRAKARKTETENVASKSLVSIPTAIRNDSNLDNNGLKEKKRKEPKEKKRNNNIIITKHAHARGGELSLEIKDKPKKKGFGKAEAEIFIKLYNQFAKRQPNWQVKTKPPTDWQVKRMARCVADAQKQGLRIGGVLQRATEAPFITNDMKPKMNLDFFTAPANPKRDVVIYKIMNGDYDDPVGKYGINGNSQRGDGGGESAARRAGRRALEQVCGEAGQPDESCGAGQAGGDVIHADYSVQE